MSCDLDFSYTYLLPLPIDASEEKMFEYYGDIHVYCPGVGAHEPLGSNFFKNH